MTEAVNRAFLKRHFGNGSGNLYEGVFQDISARLEKDNGKPDDYLDLHRLSVACAQRDLAKRRAALSVLLDTEQALNFMAVEMIIANWDGYTLYQNNYRIYHSPTTDRFTIVPHGIDNAFFESGLSFMPPRKSVLALAYLSTGARIALPSENASHGWSRSCSIGSESMLGSAPSSTRSSRAQARRKRTRWSGGPLSSGSGCTNAGGISRMNWMAAVRPPRCSAHAGWPRFPAGSPSPIGMAPRSPRAAQR